jgi:hypothetical protein
MTMCQVIGLVAGVTLAACAGTVADQARSPAAPAPMPAGRVVPAAVDDACSERAPAPRISVTTPLSADDLAKISTIVGASAQFPIIAIAEQPVAGGRVSPSRGADRVLTVMVFGGYDSCYGLGKNSGSMVERVAGRWRLLGKPGSIVEHVH